MNIWNVDDVSIETMMIVTEEDFYFDKKFETGFSASMIRPSTFLLYFTRAQLLHPSNTFL